MARMIVNKEQMIEVGVFRCNDDWTEKRFEITNAEALAAWNGK